MIEKKMLSFSLRHTLSILLVALIPTFACILLIGSQANLLYFTPVWSDEIFYWHQILTFKVAGFQGGYYTINEAGAAASFTHFYTYGPWFTMIYGAIARITGWERITFVIFNMAFVTGALVLFCRVVQLGGRQLLMLGVTLGTFWCLVTYLPTAMQEAFQQTLAILIATIMFVAFTRREKISWRWYASGLILFVLAALMRISWGILIFPFLWLTSQPHVLRRIGSFMLGLLLLGVVYSITQYTGSPGNNSIATMVDKFSISFADGWSAFTDYFGSNFARFFSFSKNALDVLQSVQVIVLVIGGLIVIGIQMVRKRAAAEALFHVYNLSTIIIAALGLYIVAGWGDYRVIGAHLTVSLLLLIAFKRYIPIQLFVLSNVLLLPAFFAFFQPEVVSKYQVDVAAIESLHHDFVAVAPFQADAPDAWCNTVIFPQESFNPYLTAVTAGMGLSFFRDANVPGYRSQYLLLNPSSYDTIQKKTNPPELEPILTTPIGILYRNRSAKCAR